MTEGAEVLTLLQLKVIAIDILEAAGYRQIPDSSGATVDAPVSLEDVYGVVRISVFESVFSLVAEWPGEQEALINLMSRFLGRSDGKSWDGYLVLLTPGGTFDLGEQLDEIRYNTVRVRKIVATGEQLSSPRNVERLLSPLLPLGRDMIPGAHFDALALVSPFLEDNREAGEAVFAAYRSGKALLPALHEHLRDHR